MKKKKIKKNILSHKKDKENDKYPKKGEIRTLAIALAISKLYELLNI